jgi:hypothetical protein
MLAKKPLSDLVQAQFPSMDNGDDGGVGVSTKSFCAKASSSEEPQKVKKVDLALN